jgi:uncharacterized membrane protein YczE
MKIKRILMSVLGVVLCGISVGFFKIAAFGVDPFQSLMSGIDKLIPLSFGILYVIVNALLLLFALIFDRHYIGIATFINLFLLGYIVEFTQWLLCLIFPGAGVAVRIVFFIVGFISLCFSSSLYMTADLGVSTYDAIAIVMAEKWKLGKFKYIRIATDSVCIVIGIAMFLLGSGAVTDIPTFVGIGTILTAFFMGPLIDFFNRTVSRPMLKM